MKNLKKYILPTLIVLGFVLRLAVILNNGPGPTYDSPSSTDEVNYRELARNISENKIYGAWSECFFTRSMRAPAYPALLALANLISSNVWTPLALNLILDTINIFLVYVFGLLVFGRKVGLWAAFLYSLFAPSFIYVRFSTTEIFAVFLIFCFLITLLQYEKILSWNCLSMVLAYVFLIHTRPSFLPLIAVLPVVIFLKIGEGRTDIKERLLRSTVPVIFVVLLCVPWSWRNYNVQGTLIPVIVIPGWHGLESADIDIELSSNMAMDFIYDSERRDWSEGMYFDEARRNVGLLLKENHLKVLAYGFLRILRGWCFPDFYKRIFLPQAYFNPVYLAEKIFIPLPDFEGIVYFSLICLAAMLVVKKALIRGAFKSFFSNRIWIFMLLVAYIMVHIISVPFPQYRFIIEPIIVVLLVGFFVGSDKVEESKIRKVSAFPILIIISLFLFIMLPLILPGKKRGQYIFKLSSPLPDAKSYTELREIQWRNKGKLPDKVHAFAGGRVRYLRGNFKFVEEGIVPAISNPNFSAAKLYVDENSKASPLGLGDLKINIHGDRTPKEEEYIFCEGSAKTGIFRELILDVERWEGLDAE
ncbi:MAG TPA: hypothetical protein PK821_00345 [Victivallales bacterium]|nr:hypothetical protein [Victivallales bacterium]